MAKTSMAIQLDSEQPASDQEDSAIEDQQDEVMNHFDEVDFEVLGQLQKFVE